MELDEALDALVAAALAEFEAFVADVLASPANVFADFSLVPFGLFVSIAHAFAEPPDAVESPEAYSFALYNPEATAVVSLEAHIFEEPVATVVP